MEINKKNLTIFCIEKNSMRCNPGIVAQICKTFDLSWEKIHKGWFLVEQLLDKKITDKEFKTEIKKLLEEL